MRTRIVAVVVGVVLVLLAIIWLPHDSETEDVSRPTRTSSSQAGCGHDPGACGYPDGATTGLTAEKALRRVPEDIDSGTGWVYDKRGWVVVNEPGAMLEDVTMSVGVSVEADNASLRNVRITLGGETFGVALRRVNNTLIEDVQIAPHATDPRLLVGIKDIYGDSTKTIVRRVDVAGASTGVQLASGIVEDSFIHDLRMIEGDHVNGITSNGSRSALTVRHNTVLNGFSQTDAIGLFQDFGTEANRRIENNLLAGGAYTLYGGAGTHGPTRGIVVTGNRFSRLYAPHGGAFGPVAAFEPDGVGNRWADNVWDDTGEVVAHG